MVSQCKVQPSTYTPQLHPPYPQSTDSPTADWQHTIETLFKASTPSATLSAQLTSLLDNYAPHDLAATLAAAASHIRQHATQPTTHVEWLTQLGMLKVPLLLGEGSAIHTTATHAMATAALQLHALGKHEHQQEALRLCGHLLAHTALVEAQHHAVAGYTLGFLLEHLHNPLPLVRDIVDTWSIAVSDDPTRQLLVQLLQSTALLPLLHSKLRTKDDDGSAAAYCQLWDIVTQRAVVLGMTLDPMSSFSALQCIMRAMRRGMLRLQEAPAAHWPPYTVVCFTHMANAAARAAHHCREVLVGTDHAQTSGAVLACLAEQLLLPAENAATADGLALASALLHAALQLSGARVAFSAQRGVESLFRVLMRCYAVMCAASQDACMAGVLSCRLLELEAKFCMVGWDACEMTMLLHGCPKSPCIPCTQLWVMLVGSVEATMPSTGAYQQGCPEVTAWKAVWEDGEGQLDAMQPFWHGVQRSGFLAFLQACDCGCSMGVFV